MIAVLMASLALAAAERSPLQIMAGKDFDALLSGVAAACPARANAVRFSFPAKLVDTEGRVIQRLEPRKRAVVAKRIAHAKCDVGVACPAGAGLTAIRRAGAMPQLVKAVCAQPEGYWR